MESAIIGKIAQEAKIPFMILRAIVDPAHFCLPYSAIIKSFNTNGQFPTLFFSNKSITST